MTSAIQLSKVCKSFGRTEIIRGVDLDIEANEIHAVIGPNGAGKSTLFHLISGRYDLTSGSIKMFGEELSNLKSFEIARKGLGRSFQVTNIFKNMTVYENIRCGALWSKGYKYNFTKDVDKLEDINLLTDEIIEKVRLTERAYTPAGLLTYAEQRALEIGITLAGGGDVIMLDEPTQGMSHSETEKIVDLVKELSEGKTMVIVEHDMGVVFSLADRISVLVYGEIIATGKPEDIKNNSDVQEAYLGTEID